MSETLFDYRSRRATQARYGKSIGSSAAYAALLFVGWLFFLGGLYLVFTGLAAGWLLTGISAGFWMVALWGKSLRELPTSPSAKQIDDVLETKVLARLPENPTPKAVAETIMSMPGGLFFGNRFMLGSTFLASLVPDSVGDMDLVWQRALEKRYQYQSGEVTSAMVACALVESIPDADQYLAHAGVDTDDIRRGLGWYMHIESLIAEHQRKKKSGGIGRDWAFGFTPMLERFGHNLGYQVASGGIITRELESRERVLGHVTDIMDRSGRRNVALVGQLGSGKTKLVHALAERLIHPTPEVPPSLRFAQVVALDPSSLIAQARGRGELEQLVQHLIVEALKAKNIVLFLDDAQLFFEDGTGSVDLSNVLLPVLEGGALRLILALDEQRWMQITQKNPGLAQYLNRVVVAPTTDDETMEVLENQAILLEHQYKVAYTYQALRASLQLSSRYIATQVMPGRALSLLEAAAHFADHQLVTKESVEQAVEQTQGIKVSAANSVDERDTLLHLEELIHARMINQTRAVQVVSDALRRARAGVRNPSRPIGTFLFLGPTGVGKTELAKSVAAVFFGGEDRIVRIDLNEYVGENDVSRLIADAGTDEHSLTAQITRQPFSVVLLDEIEKAHPNVLSALLQLLDEGILRDINNREVSFRDAVIVATSNAGADRIRQHIEAGEQLEQFEQQFTDELINANIFRPEFINRFDETVLFRPLTPEELLQVVNLILEGVNKNLAAQKVSVAVDDDAKKMLVDAGYDPRLGARPMRRIVQKVVENIVANQVLAQQVHPGGQVHVTAADVQTMLARNRQ